MGSLENGAFVRTSTVGNVKTTSTTNTLASSIIKQSKTNFDIPTISSEEAVSNVDLDELTSNPTTSEIEDTNPMQEKQSSNVEIDTPVSEELTLDFIEEERKDNLPVTTSDTNQQGDVTVREITSDTSEETPSNTNAPEEIGESSENKNGKELFAANITYEAPITTDNTDMDMSEILLMSEEDLLTLIGNMTAEEYAQFIEGMQKYYDSQLQSFEWMLNGYNGEMGYLDYIDWIMEFLEDNQLFTHPYEETICGYEGMAHDLLDRYDFSMLPEWFAERFPNGNITYEEYKQLTRDEQWAFLVEQGDETALQINAYIEGYSNRINSAVKEEFGEFGITSYKELMEAYYDLQSNVEMINQSIKLTKNLKLSAWYDYLPYLEDYNNYEMHKVTEEEIECIKKTIIPSSTGTTYLNYNQVKQQYPNLSPLDYLLAVKEIYPHIGNSQITMYGVSDTAEIQTIARIYDICPDYAKKYNYLYSLSPEGAKKFLEDCRYQLNNIEGQLEAAKFLSYLGELDGDYDKLDAIKNTLGVTAEGLFDGLEGFTEGVYYALEALLTLLRKCEENRVMSAEEYKKMYILQALLPKEAQEKVGLIIKNSDGTYQNNSEVNPLGIMDYTKTYSGLWLNHKYSIAQGIGNMLPSILLTTVNPALGSWSLGISAGGNAYHSAMVDGKSYLDAVFYGLFTGSSEAFTERLLGGLPGLSEVKVTSLATYIKAVGREGFQEGFQGALDYLYKALFMNEPLPDIKDIAGWEKLLTDIGTQAFYGAVTAGIMQSPSLMRSVYNTHQINQFMNANGITIAEQQAAMNEIRRSKPEYAKLTDSEIKTMFGKELATLSMINKTATEFNVSKDAARLILALNIDADVANTMLKYDMSLTEAQEFIREHRTKIIDDVETRTFIENYLKDDNTVIPSYMNKELVDYLRKFKINPECTMPPLPDSLIDYFSKQAEVMFFNGEEGYQEFLSEVEKSKNEVTERYGDKFSYWSTMGVETLCVEHTPAYVFAYLDSILNYYSQWRTNGSLFKYNLNVEVLENIETLIGKAREMEIFPSSMTASFSDRLSMIKEGYSTHNFSLFAGGVLSYLPPGVNTRVSSSGAIELTGLQPNSVYELKYFIKSSKGVTGSYSETIIVRTDANGVGTAQQLSPEGFMHNMLIYGEQYTFEDLTVKYRNSDFQGETTPGHAENSPYYKQMQAFDGSFGLKQSVFTFFDFDGDSDSDLFFEDKSLSETAEAFAEALNGETVPNIKHINELKNIVRKYLPTLTDADIIAYLRNLDSEGACSHAATINQFLLQWHENPSLFKKIFGYDLYRKTPSGDMVFNAELLLADYYTFLNKNNSSFFTKDYYNQTDRYKKPDSHIDQVFSSAEGFENFLNWKLQQAGMSETVTVSQTELFGHNTSVSNQEIYTTLKQGIDTQTEVYEFGFWVNYDEGQQVKLYSYNPDTGLFDIPTTTDAWFSNSSDYEKGLSRSGTSGHATTIVDVSETGLYVQSWGKLYYVPFEGLKYARYDIKSFKVNIK